MQPVFILRAEQKALHVCYCDFVNKFHSIGSLNFSFLFFSIPIDLLIDISDVLQICCYELGRTYLKLSQALCINLPSIGEYILTSSHTNVGIEWLSIYIYIFSK